MALNQNKVAFISGANRGIGLETAKKLGELGITVVLGVRDLAKGQAALDTLKSNGIDADLVHYDANDEKTNDEVFDYLNSKYGKLDILVNNAGIILEGILSNNSSSSVSQQTLKDTFNINLFAVVSLTQKLLPLIKKSATGRIVNVSSILGSLTLHSMENSPIDPAKAFAYNASKTALNAYTVHLASELKNTAIKVNAAHPGWVKTELGGSNAPMEVADSYKTSLHLATLDDNGPNGGFFHEGEPLPW